MTDARAIIDAIDALFTKPDGTWTNVDDVVEFVGEALAAARAEVWDKVELYAKARASELNDEANQYIEAGDLSAATDEMAYSADEFMAFAEWCRQQAKEGP